MKTHRKWLVSGVLITHLAMAGIFFFPDRMIPNRPSAELVKLFQVFQPYRSGDYKIIYNGNTYGIEAALRRLKRYLAFYYRGEKIESWIRARLYRSPDEGKIIYLVFPDGSRRPLRNVLMTDLKQFPTA